MAARLRGQLTAPPPAAHSANHQSASSHAAEKLTCVIPTCDNPIVRGQSKMLRNKDGNMLGYLCLSCRKSLRANNTNGKGTWAEKLQHFVNAAEAANVSLTPTARCDAAATAEGQGMPASASQDALLENDFDANDGGTGGNDGQVGDVLINEPPVYPSGLRGPPTPNPQHSSTGFYSS
jgi:hypothetical protein